MKREVFNPPNVLEDQALTEQREKEYIERYHPRAQRSERIRDMLEGINTEKLREIFAEKATLLGKDPRELNFIGKDRIHSMAGGHYTGYFNNIHNILLMAEPKLGDTTENERQRVELGRRHIETYGSSKLAFLAILTHEETHAVSKNRLVSLTETPRWKKHPTKPYIDGVIYDFEKKQSGYFRESGPDAFSIFHAFNEGMVERFSREIVLQYLEQSNWAPEEAATYRDTVKNHPEKLGYSNEVALVDAIIRHLAAKSNRSEKDTWDWFVRGLFDGQTFEEKEVRDIFDQAFGPEFLNELSRIQIESNSTGSNKEMTSLKQKYGMEK